MFVHCVPSASEFPLLHSFLCEHFARKRRLLHCCAHGFAAICACVCYALAASFGCGYLKRRQLEKSNRIHTIDAVRPRAHALFPCSRPKREGLHWRLATLFVVIVDNISWCAAAAAAAAGAAEHSVNLFVMCLFII